MTAGNAGSLTGGGLRTDEFDYDLPPGLIAQTPLAQRDHSRMLALDRATGSIAHHTIADLPAFVRPGDLLVANNSRVIPARLTARRDPSGGQVELLLLRKDGTEWLSLARPARRLHPGDRLLIDPRERAGVEPARVRVTAMDADGLVRVTFDDRADERLEAFGAPPLPPYIGETLTDPERYQTTYARVPGSAAAPTAGLHITPDLRRKLADAGASWAEVTLHIGLDTFRPVAVERIADHRIHSEWCDVPADVARLIAETKARGHRVIAIGTTSARTLETLGARPAAEQPRGYTGPTSIFIVPGHRWRVVDGLLTNFHLPRSTLLMMVSALAGRETVLTAYRAAIARRYRFYSFGDAMLIV